MPQTLPATRPGFRQFRVTVEQRCFFDDALRRFQSLAAKGVSTGRARVGRLRGPRYNRRVSRQRLYRADAIVLKRHDHGEADRILTLYTREQGKVSVIAKGVRRIASRKSGHVELFTHSTFMLAKGRNLDVLTQADTVEPFAALREDLIRTTYAYHVAELCDRLTEEDNPNPQAFELLRGALEALCEADDPSLVVRFFEIRLLGLSGYRPQLFHCALCGETLGEEGNAFSPEAGGMLCPKHRGQMPDTLPLDAASFRVLRFLQTRDWAMARRIDLTPATRGALERVMHSYLRHLLERDLNSTGFLRNLRAVADSLDLGPLAPNSPPAAPTPTPSQGS